MLKKIVLLTGLAALAAAQQDNTQVVDALNVPSMPKCSPQGRAKVGLIARHANEQQDNLAQQSNTPIILFFARRE